MLRQAIHFAAGRHSNLVRATVVADRCASSVAAMEKSSQGCGESGPQTHRPEWNGVIQL